MINTIPENATIRKELLNEESVSVCKSMGLITTLTGKILKARSWGKDTLAIICQKMKNWIAIAIIIQTDGKKKEDPLRWADSNTLKLK